MTNNTSIDYDALVLRVTITMPDQYDWILANCTRRYTNYFVTIEGHQIPQSVILLNPDEQAQFLLRWGSVARFKYVTLRDMLLP